MSSDANFSDQTTKEPKSNVRITACQQCRKRKLKCDGLRPICTNCTKPRVRGLPKSQKLNPPPPECIWDDLGGTERNRRRRSEESVDELERSKRARLVELEERMATMERNIQAQQGRLTPNMTYSGEQQDTTVHTDTLFEALDTGNTLHRNGRAPNTSSQTQHAASSGAKPYTTSLHPVYTTEANKCRPGELTSENRLKNKGDLLQPSDFDPFEGFHFDDVPKETHPMEMSSMDSNHFGTMVRADWPRGLPPINTVEHVVQVFFDKVPTIPKMLHRSTFQQYLRLPPSNDSFPALPLLHAILCATSSYLSPASFTDREYWPIGTPIGANIHPEQDHEIHSSDQPPTLHNATGGLDLSGRTSTYDNSAKSRFQSWHRRRALAAVIQYIDRGQKFIQSLQATIIIAATDQLNARWSDSWQLSGGCIRLAIPMRIYQSSLIPANAFQGRGSMPRANITGPLEQAERDRTWWMAYLVERTGSMWTTWPVAMADDEITCELPVLQSTFDQGYGNLKGIQSLDAHDLYSNHPPCHFDSLSLFIKAVKLFTEAQRFLRFYQRRPHTVERYINEPNLRLLLSQVNLFRLSIPAHLRRPTRDLAAGGQLDRDLLTAIMLAHATSIALGEPLVTRDTWQHDLATMGLGSIRAILSLVYDITATTYDLTFLPASISYIFWLTSKSLMRFVEAATQVGDVVSVSVFRSEVGVFQMALRQYGERFPLGVAHAKMLDDLISEYERNGIISNATYTVMNTYNGMVRVEPVSGTVEIIDSPFVDTATISRSSFSNGPPEPASIKSDSIFGTTPFVVSEPAGTPSAAMSMHSAIGRDQELNLNEYLKQSSGDGIGLAASSSASIDWFDVANFSFDSEQVSEMFRTVTSGM